MATRRDIAEAALFLPGMALVAAAIGGALYLIILGGGALLRALYWLAAAVGLPFPAALTLALMLAAFLVATFVPLGLSWLGDHWPASRKRP